MKINTGISVDRRHDRDLLHFNNGAFIGTLNRTTEAPYLIKKDGDELVDLKSDTLTLEQLTAILESDSHAADCLRYQMLTWVCDDRKTILTADSDTIKATFEQMVEEWND